VALTISKATVNRDWFYFILQPEVWLTYRIQIQCINQCYMKT